MSPRTHPAQAKDRADRDPQERVARNRDGPRCMSCPVERDAA
ncbi:hypothetical protein SSCG_03066 [Streptomyces clavuligerus]|nr:hypothetical protein SSCG_03066 [Streptomyces clavuligerus]